MILVAKKIGIMTKDKLEKGLMLYNEIEGLEKRIDEFKSNLEKEDYVKLTLGGFNTYIRRNEGMEGVLSHLVRKMEKELIDKKLKFKAL